MKQIKATKALGIKKLTGLIGKNKIEPLLIETRFGIHTFGVKSPIDVVILDKKNNVIKIKKSLKPNRVFFWSLLFCKVLELPEKSIEKNNIKIKKHIRLTIKD